MPTARASTVVIRCGGPGTRLPKHIGVDGRIRGFQHEPRFDHWINSGSFCFEPSALACVEDASVGRCRTGREQLREEW